ncbi:hypothetical protein K458DRAFT_410069 [Lentithecium fluviatile CBS 122367]|uniref:Uncharacterized protein n=1 Tax=Lentithecium fluviatile CBS 122367 TaxID=1168545 RepID=A0A6G1IF68_9PLEO|nr:hypothetical protein K458DRAFT_410069 [Lentithecium fluviatile CBS 122367]
MRRNATFCENLYEPNPDIAGRGVLITFMAHTVYYIFLGLVITPVVNTFSPSCTQCLRRAISRRLEMIANSLHAGVTIAGPSELAGTDTRARTTGKSFCAGIPGTNLSAETTVTNLHVGTAIAGVLRPSGPAVREKPS